MEYTFRNWNKNDIYNFNIEFNRIEEYNKYIELWLKNYYGFSFETLVHKTDWTIEDIVDLNDFNRVKRNINVLLEQLSISNNELPIVYIDNYFFDDTKANEIESRLISNLEVIGNSQWQYNITGLTTCSNNDLKLGGVK